MSSCAKSPSTSGPSARRPPMPHPPPTPSSTSTRPRAEEFPMIRYRLAAAIGGLVLALPALTAQEIKEREIRAHIEFLSSDLLEGRAPATRGGALTESYLAAQMRYLGLEPAVNGSYLQRVPIDVVAAERGSIRANASGKATATLRYPDDVVMWAGSSTET